MTLTSIGYGEMLPVNTAERVLCSVYMIFSGVLWTYAIGQVASIATTLNPTRIAYENTMYGFQLSACHRAVGGSLPHRGRAFLLQSSVSCVMWLCASSTIPSDDSGF